MNEFKHTQFIFTVAIDWHAHISLGTNNEEKTGVTAVNDLVTTVLQKGALQLGTTQAFANDFRFQSDAFLHGDPFVIGGQTSLALFVSKGTSKEACEQEIMKKCYDLYGTGKQNETLIVSALRSRLRLSRTHRSITKSTLTP
jgi:hypothetical protein